MGRVSEKGSAPQSAVLLLVNYRDQGGRLFLLLGMSWGVAVLVEPWPVLVPSYLWAEVLLDTSGETSEIGWLTYPPGGVSVTFILNPWPCPHPSPWRVELGKEPLGREGLME